MPARPPSDEGPVRFGDVLGVRPSAPTISDVRIAVAASVDDGSVAPGGRDRGRLVLGAGAAAALVVASLAATYGFGHRPDAPSLRAAAPAPSGFAASILPSSEPPGHSAAVVPPAPAPSPPPLATTAAPRPRIPVVPTRSARPSTRASDDDLIE
jgi:hypothetical protein